MISELSAFLQKATFTQNFIGLKTFIKLVCKSNSNFVHIIYMIAIPRIYS